MVLGFHSQLIMDWNQYSIRELYDNYCEWVAENPGLSSQMESLFKFFSYLGIGKLGESRRASEGVYCLFNLISFFNDYAFLRANDWHSVKFKRYGNNVKTWLTIVEYCEAYIELATEHKFGSAGKWKVIVLVQLIKCLSRITLLMRDDESFVSHPPIPPLDRNVKESEPSIVNNTYRLKSGVVIRKIYPGDPIAYYDGFEQLKDLRQEQNVPLMGWQRVGEILYIVKPLAHLLCYQYSHKTDKKWLPWVSSLLIDLVSISLLKRQKDLSSRQEAQRTLRMVNLLMYLLRSPFYNEYGKFAIYSCLFSLKKVFPFIGLLIDPLLDYLPEWQKTYFYTWSH